VSLYRHTVKLLTALRKPVVQSLAPLCITCGRHLDKEEIVEGYPEQTTFVRVRGQHHGADELVTFDMGSTEWSFEDVAKHVRSHCWFDPRLVEK